MKLAIVVGLGLAMALGGCQTARVERERSEDDAKCRSYGAQPGSPQYVQCRTSMDTARTQSDAVMALR